MGEYLPNVTKFCIFNPKFGQKEGEEEKKILYFYSMNTDLNSQVKSTCLNEAIIKFTRTLDASANCKWVRSSKEYNYFYEPEIDFWMIMTVSLSNPDSQIGNVIVAEPNARKNISSYTYLHKLKQVYSIFQFVLGSFNSLLNACSNDIILFKTKLHNFFSWYLRGVIGADCNIITEFQGVPYLTLDRRVYLRVQCFSNLFNNKFKSYIDYSILFVQHYYIWSSMDITKVESMYKFLISSFVKPFLQNVDIQEDKCMSYSVNNTIFYKASPGEFVLYPLYCENNKWETFCNGYAIPKIAVRLGYEQHVHYIVVYRVFNSTFFMFLKNEEISIDVLKNIESFLRVKLGALASELSTYINESKKTEEYPHKYIYFNEYNLAKKTNMNSSDKSLTFEVVNLLANSSDMYKENSSEIVLKSKNDFWIVKQRSNSRQVYVVIQQKNSTLIDVDEELSKFHEQQLKSIFFYV